MSWLVIVGIVVIAIIAAEACLIIPDKFPWNRRKKR